MVEMVVVCVIIGLMMALAIPTLKGWRRISHHKQFTAAAQTLRDAAAAFAKDHGNRAPVIGPGGADPFYVALHAWLDPFGAGYLVGDPVGGTYKEWRYATAQEKLAGPIDSFGKHYMRGSLEDLTVSGGPDGIFYFNGITGGRFGTMEYHSGSGQFSDRYIITVRATDAAGNPDPKDPFFCNIGNWNGGGWDQYGTWVPTLNVNKPC